MALAKKKAWAGVVLLPNNTGKKYKKHVSPEEDGRRFGSKPSIYQDLDGDQIKKMCSIGCTKAEIASIMGVSVDTIDKYIKEFFNMGFSEFYKTYADGFKMSLRRMQYKSAMGEYDEEIGKYTLTPSVPMQIWLGKQYLDQKDKHENVIEDKTNIPQFEWADAEDVTEQKQLEDGQETEENYLDSYEGEVEDDQ
jgi:hypothetical protein